MAAASLTLVLVVSALGAVITPRFSEPTPFYSNYSPTEGDTE